MGFLKLFDAVAEKIILDAMENGEFDNLPGNGKRLVFTDESMIPPDLRMGYKILKNSGHIPEELEQEREIRNIKDLLAGCKDERERYRQMQKLNYMVLKANMMRRRPIYLEKSQYYDQIAERVKLNPEKPRAAPAPAVSPAARMAAATTPPSNDTIRCRFSLISWLRTRWTRVYS